MSTKENLATVKILKFDPLIDKTPRYETFHVPYEGQTVLNVLEAVYRDFDRELAFRYGCEGKHDSRCGACAVDVNGVSALACRKISEKEMVIEPHAKFEILKDLVVNFNEVKKEPPNKVPSVRIAIDSEKCMKCADCVDICPVGVYEAKKGEIEVSDAQFCCGDTCHQCVTFCQAGAITVSAVPESYDMENKR
jgi:succinate dehydrogenase/fumarate reductase-like Fe-S protein